MFGDEYKKAMSFPAPERLVRDTERRMRAAAQARTTFREIPPLWRRGLVTAAAFCMVVLAAVAYTRLRSTGGGASAEISAASAGGPEGVAGFSLGALNESDPNALDSNAPLGANGADSGATAPNGLGAVAPRNAQKKDSSLPKIKLQLADADDSSRSVVWARGAGEVMNSANPWTVERAGEISTLPVFRNTCQLDAAEMPMDGAAVLPYKQLESIAQAAADETGLTLLPHGGRDDFYAANGAFAGYGARTAEGYRLQVLQNGDVLFSGNPAGAEEPRSFDALCGQIWDQYKPLFGQFGLQNPALNFCGGDSPDGARYANISVYDASGTLPQQIVNFQKAAPLAVWQENEAYYPEAIPAVRLYRPQEPWKLELGDYPIRTLGEAAATLQQGGYVTAGPPDCALTADTVVGVELMYYGNSHTEYVQPVYSFYVKLPLEASADAPADLQAYGVYMVAAVKPEYLE